jgi:hypothetical protein
MADKPADSAAPETAPPSPSNSSSFRHFQRRPWSERAKSGKVLPPAPEWMQKPLKPPTRRPPPVD